MKASTKALKVLKRNLYGTILLGFLMPIFAVYNGEEAKQISMISFAIVFFTFLNLQYANRLEKVLKEEAIID